MYSNDLRNSPYKVMRDLAVHGYTSLKGLAVLMNVHTQTVYQRQQSNNPIPVVKVGRMARVHEDVVLEEMQKAIKRGNDWAEVHLGLYLRQYQGKTHESEDK